MPTNHKKEYISLIPIFSSDFNNCRSPTKFFDATRLNSVGIYTNFYPYKSFIRNGIDGFLLPNHIDIWVEKINYLLDNEKTRLQAIENAKSRIINLPS